jgi:hypothetical protein
MTMRRLDGSVNANIVVIDGITMGDGVIMGDCKFWDGRGSCNIDDVVLGHTVSSALMQFNCHTSSYSSATCMNSGHG